MKKKVELNFLKSTSSGLETARLRFFKTIFDANFSQKNRLTINRAHPYIRTRASRSGTRLKRCSRRPCRWAWSQHWRAVWLWPGKKCRPMAPRILGPKTRFSSFWGQAGEKPGLRCSSTRMLASALRLTLANGTECKEQIGSEMFFGVGRVVFDIIYLNLTLNYLSISISNSDLIAKK